jgi:hypothetical protein
MVGPKVYGNYVRIKNEDVTAETISVIKELLAVQMIESLEAVGENAGRYAQSYEYGPDESADMVRLSIKMTEILH